MDDFEDIGTLLRENRHSASQLELDELKQRALRRAERASARKSGRALRSRLVTMALVMGLTFGVASAGVIAGGGSSSNDKSAAVSQYVLGETAAPGSARLTGPGGCPSRTYTVRVTGRNIQRVVYRLDGRVIKTVRRPDSRGRFAVKINPKRLAVGVHKLTGTVTFKAVTKKRAQVLRLTLKRCAAKRAAPRFTG